MIIPKKSLLLFTKNFLSVAHRRTRRAQAREVLIAARQVALIAAQGAVRIAHIVLDQDLEVTQDHLDIHPDHLQEGNLK